MATTTAITKCACQTSPSPSEEICRFARTTDLDLDTNVHWSDYKVLKKCLVKRWEDITKSETCLHSLWSKRKSLESTLSESHDQIANLERSLLTLNNAVDILSKDIDEQQFRFKDLDREISQKQVDVDNLVMSTGGPARRPPSPTCACRRFSAAVNSDMPTGNHIRSVMASVSSLKALQNDIKRNVETLQAQLNCKMAERLNAKNRKEHLGKVVEQVTRDLLAVNEECETVNNRWKEYRCEVEKLQTKMIEQWGPSAVDKLTPATASRSRFF